MVKETNTIEYPAFTITTGDFFRMVDVSNTTNHEDGKPGLNTAQDVLNWIEANGAAPATFISSGKLADARLNLGQEHLYIPAAAMISRTTSGAEAAKAELATSLINLETFNFDQGADEFVQFAMQMPKSWNEGTLIAQFIWSHPTTTTNFDVTWAIQAAAFANGDNLNGASPFGTAVTVTDTGGTLDTEYTSAETGAMTVAGTPAAEEWVVFQVYRDVSGPGASNLAVDARLHGVKIHWTKDALSDD